MIVMIDNYDSFTYNLVQAFLMLGADVRVYRNDALTPDAARELSPTHLCISPGPGTPYDAGVSMEMIRAFAGRIPVLGVCLGHQSIVEVFGGKVVRALKSTCLDESNTDTSCIKDVPTGVDTDTLSLGGHGSHVYSIAAGRSVTLSDGTTVAGAAPEAKIVSLSTGAVVAIISADASMNWVLEHHAAPCGAGVSAAKCPPIRVVNNSYGSPGGGEFDPKSATVKLQRQLASEGVVTRSGVPLSGGIRPGWASPRPRDERDRDDDVHPDGREEGRGHLPPRAFGRGLNAAENHPARAIPCGSS